METLFNDGNSYSKLQKLKNTDSKIKIKEKDILKQKKRMNLSYILCMWFSVAILCVSEV